MIEFLKQSVRKVTVIIFVSLIVAMAGLMPVEHAIAAECTVSIRLDHFPNGNGPPTPIYVAGAVTVGKDDILSLHYEITNCVVGTRPYTITASAGGFATATIVNGSMNSDISQDKTVPKPTSSGKIVYNISLYKNNGSPRVIDKQSEVTVTYNVSATQTNTNASANQNTNAAPPASTNVDIAKIKNPFKSGTVPGVAARVIQVLFILIVIAAVIVIVISGFRMLVGGGNPDQIKKAKSGIIWAIIGLVVALMSYAIVTIIQRLL